MRTWLIAWVLFGVAGGALSGQVSPPRYDLVIRGGTVVDGTGAPRFRADVAIQGDRIVRLSREGLSAASARQSLNAEGLVVAPGFIDHHAHVQEPIFRRPLAESFIRQGITTILASLHSHDMPYPLGEWMGRLESAPNIGFFAGHNWARRQVMGTVNRSPTAAELDGMRDLVEEAMEAGALGLSTGLRYIPGAYAETEEVIELAKVAARHGGIYVSHMRDEASGVLESVEELIRIAEEGGLPAQVQHHKVMGASQWGWSKRTLAMVDSARDRGLDIKMDLYPYTATSTSSAVLFPPWALAGGTDSLAARLEDPRTRRRIEQGIRERLMRERGGGDLSNIQFARFAAYPQYNGKTLADFAADRGMPNNLETGVQLAQELQLQGGFAGIWHVLNEDDVIRIMTHPSTMICTDGDLVAYGEGNPHPRGYGAFPRVLARYVRDLEVLSLEEAVRRMTSLSADQIGQFQRGRIAEGMYADLTIFDPETVEDRAEFTDPHQFPVGVHHVVVNGVPVIRDRSLTGAKPGRALTGPSRPDEVVER